MIFRIIVLLGLFFLISCSNSEVEAPKCDFDQDFSAPVGSLVIERNGMPAGMASAFLINKEEGRFTTADHFIAYLRQNTGSKMYLFFECKKYNVSLERIAGIHDAANVYVTDEFNVEEWPDPYSINKDPVQLEDTVHVQGIHIHPWSLHLHNKNRGFDDKPVYILRDYYNVFPGNDATRSEFIFDDLRGVVFETDVTKGVLYDKGSISPDMQNIRTKTNLFFSLRTVRNHRISFGGLSGGAVINKDDEIVGIITLESPQRIILPNFRVSVEYRTISVTPVTEVEDIFQYHQDW